MDRLGKKLIFLYDVIIMGQGLQGEAGDDGVRGKDGVFSMSDAQKQIISNKVKKDTVLSANITAAVEAIKADEEYLKANKTTLKEGGIKDATFPNAVQRNAEGVFKFPGVYEDKLSLDGTNFQLGKSRLIDSEGVFKTKTETGVTGKPPIINFGLSPCGTRLQADSAQKKIDFKADVVTVIKDWNTPDKTKKGTTGHSITASTVTSDDIRARYMILKNKDNKPVVSFSIVNDTIDEKYDQYMYINKVLSSWDKKGLSTHEIIDDSHDKGEGFGSLRLAITPTDEKRKFRTRS